MRRLAGAALGALWLFGLTRCSDDVGPVLSGDAGDDGAVVPPEDASSDGSGPSDAATLGPTEPVLVGTSAGKDEDPSVLVAADGTLYVTWFSDRSGAPDLYLRTSKNGVDWSPDRNITNDAAADFAPSLIQARDGRFHLAWFRGNIGPDSGLHGSIWYKSSLDTETWTTPIELAATGALAWTPSIVERVAGELVVVWSSDATGDRDLYLLRSINGGASFSGTPVRLTDAAFNDDLPALAVRPDGSLVLAWQRYDAAIDDNLNGYLHPTNELVYAVSTVNGAFSPPLVPVAITNDPPAQEIPDVTPSLFASGDGLAIAFASIRTPGSSAGNTYALGLGRGIDTLRPLMPNGYSPRLAQVTGDLYLMAWVTPVPIDGGDDLEVAARLLRDPPR